ncbi:hypothetical protein SNE40_018105 [Patella caerulea]|uniref:Uncharacterized protein n=1 Tax=Patella caerulea TaxID=87958 RepID=A0AAN8JB78_PATCE
MARTKNTQRKHPPPTLPRATFPTLAPDLRDPTVRSQTRPRMRAPRTQWSPPSFTPPTSPMSPLPATPPRFTLPVTPPRPTSPPSPARSLSPIFRRPRREKKSSMKGLKSFIRKLQHLTPDMAYGQLVKNTGRARIGLLQWFKLAANHLLKGNIQPLHAQHKKWVERNRQVLTQLTERNMPTTEKLSLIMKPGGRGFFGGVLIRILLRWKERLQEERNKKRNQFVRRTAQRGRGLSTEELNKHRALLRKLSNVPPDVKRRLVDQQGGAIGALLAMALPALAPLVSNLLGGQKGGKHPFLRRHDRANAMAAELSKLFGG